MKKKIAKVASLFFAAAMVCTIGKSPVKANSFISETEDNNSAQTANEVFVVSGETVIGGSVRADEREEQGFLKDEYDWYKITFEDQGKCDFRLSCTSDSTKSSWTNEYCLDVYDKDFNSVSSYKYGLVHDAGDVYYVRVESASYIIGTDEDGWYYEYQLSLNDDTSEEYVSNNHFNSSSAYMLTPGKRAYALGWNSTHSRYFSFKVPKGKLATLYFEPVADADVNKIISSPYDLELVRLSDNEVLASGSAKTKLSLSEIKNEYSGKFTKLTGSNTYVFSVNGGYSPNCQWYSVRYELKDYKVDHKKPTVTGVTNGKTYKKAVIIKFKDESGIKSAKLNKKKIKSGTKVTKNGSYVLSVTDKSGNTKTVRFKIRK